MVDAVSLQAPVSIRVFPDLPRERPSQPTIQPAAAGRGVQTGQDAMAIGSEPEFTAGTSRTLMGNRETMLFVLVGLLLSWPATAVAVPFENCLAESYTSFSPVPLQWRPLYVDASYTEARGRHSLRVTMWGNVTGASTNVSLPAGGSPYWTDSTRLDGKIVDVPEPDSEDPKVTSLHSSINVLTYQPYSEYSAFCNDSLTNATCPLAPVFRPLVIPADLDMLPSVAMQDEFERSYAFSSLVATFSIIYGDGGRTYIGCVSTTLTPELGDLAWMLKVLPLLILMAVGGASIFASIFSPWGTVDMFRWTSNYGRDADLLRLITPGFGDCLQYVQFVTLTGGLSLRYPGFYRPMVSQAAWSVLMFNQSFVTGTAGRVSVVDGLYATNSTYGLEDIAQLVGMSQVQDMWAGVMVWLLVMVAVMFVVVQLGFGLQWIYRAVKKIPEEDLRAKNIPFTLGNVVRIALNFFLLPLVAMSTFQLVVASHSPAYTVSLAAATLVFIVLFAAWLLKMIATSKPRVYLFEDLPTVLLYGPLYNTFSDEAVTFALIPVLCTFLKGFAIGAVQISGVAQLVLLGMCELVQILTLHAFRPYQPATSMNAYHTVLSLLRLVTILLMVAFVPSMSVEEGARGWIGYAILLTHAVVLVLAFFFRAIMTTVEVALRMTGAGNDHGRAMSKGGLSKIFGMRQLSRRMSRLDADPSRQSQLSAMLHADEATDGFFMLGGRARSESAASIGVLLQDRHGSSTLPDKPYVEARPRHGSSTSFLTRTTVGEPSYLAYLLSPGVQSQRSPGVGASDVALTPSDPYYRPPRRRGQTLDSPTSPPEQAGESPQRRASQPPAPGDSPEYESRHSRAPTPASFSHVIMSVPRQDYSIREVDFYYGVRGQRLNSGAPARKLGTGPADPTGTVASATGWLKTVLRGKGKVKCKKGFEVVRSSRAPPIRAGSDRDTQQVVLEGIPVAIDAPREPIESDDDNDDPRTHTAAHTGHRRRQSSQEAELLNEHGDPRNDDADADPIPASTPPTAVPRTSRFRENSDDENSLFYLATQSALPRKSSRRTPEHSRHSSTTQLVPSPEPRISHQIYSATPSMSRLSFEHISSQKKTVRVCPVVTDGVHKRD